MKLLTKSKTFYEQFAWENNLDSGVQISKVKSLYMNCSADNPESTSIKMNFFKLKNNFRLCLC